MNPRATALLLLAVLGLGAFLYFYEIGGESGRLDAEQRAKRLFAGIEPADVSWIALRTTDGVDARFERRDGKWQLVAPIAFPADASLERLADGLATATSETTLAHAQPDAEYGLDDAHAKVVHFGAKGVDHELRLGRNTPIGSNVYARTGEANAVHTIANFRATAFARTLADLRDKQILALDPTAIGSVDARWPGGRVVVERASAPSPSPKPDAEGLAPAGDWKMTVPLAAAADGDAIDNLLSTLSFLRADAFVDAPTDAQRKQLETPDFEVALTNRDAKQAPLALAIGRADGDHRLVRAGSGAVLYQIPAARLADLPRTTAAYRERHLARFAATDAQRVDFFYHVRRGDPVAIRAERSGDGWSSTPEPFASGKLADVVSELSRLEASDIVAESMGEAELEKLGLSPPNTIITVLGATPQEQDKAKNAKAPEVDASHAEGAVALPPGAPRLAEIHLGKVTPKGVAVRAVGDPIVYRLDLETAERLPVSLDAFQSRFREQPAAAAPPPAEPAPGAPPQPAEDSP
jgi:hypothetical protein